MGTPSFMNTPARPSQTGVEAVEAPEETPAPLETAISKKLAISRSFSSTSQPSPGHTSHSPFVGTTAGEHESSDDEQGICGEMKGYRLVDCGRFSQAVGEIGVCSVCASPLTAREDLTGQRGLLSKLSICCTNTDCGKKAKVSDPYSQEAKSVNARSVLAMREIGRGRAYLQTFCGVMDMLPPVVGHTPLLVKTPCDWHHTSPCGHLTTHQSLLHSVGSSVVGRHCNSWS